MIPPGDIVFHWFTGGSGESAIIGWSEAVGPLAVEDLEWSVHAGNMAGTQTGAQPNWVMPLGGLHLLADPITASELTTRREDISAIRDDLEQAHSSRGALNFLFITHSRRIRGFQGYTTKMPAALVALLGQIADLELPSNAVTGEVEVDERLVRSADANEPVRYWSDGARCRAIALHAVERAIELYEREGAAEIIVLGKPYDLRVLLDGVERHIEVKGSSGTAGAVLVTRNEVHHARHHDTTDLIVIDRITLNVEPDGSVKTSGGRLRRWLNWRPVDEQLSATAFECLLPQAS